MPKNVTVYSTQTCGYCGAAKEYLREHQIDFTEVDVGADQEKAREMIEKSGQMGVPVIIVSDGDREEIVIGFDQQRLASVLGL